MKYESKLSRLVLVSPWFLLTFLIIPILVILSLTLHVQLPLAGARPLLYNNACFALLIAFRFIYRISRLRKAIRYGADYRRPESGVTFPVPIAEAREKLENAGFTFDGSGSYGEKRDLGYLGVALLYGGILFLLAVGTWDSLRQFSGTLLDGIGPATRLNRIESYRTLNMGPLAARPDSLPRMRIVRQMLPDSEYPRGATEVALVFDDGREEKQLLKPGERFRYGAYDIYMTKLVFEPEIVISTIHSQTVFGGFVKLYPLVQNVGEYSFYGSFASANLTGDVYYQPERSRLKVVMKRDGKRVLETEMLFQIDRLVGQADLVLSCEKMGQWSEIHVVRRRHMELLALGAIIAAIGALMRIAIRPQRVWLEEAPEGCLVKAVGGEAERRLKAEG